jgi:hypothetical protein
VLLTRPPLTSSGASSIRDPFDLHVLGTPPAFVLSQDQTLHEREPEGSYLIAGLPSDDRSRLPTLFVSYAQCSVFKEQSSVSRLPRFRRKVFILPHPAPRCNPQFLPVTIIFEFVRPRRLSQVRFVSATGIRIYHSLQCGCNR